VPDELLASVEALGRTREREGEQKAEESEDGALERAQPDALARRFRGALAEPDTSSDLDHRQGSHEQ
jgi:hypothetical protein